MTNDEARDVADAVSLCGDPWPLTYIAAALSRSFAQFDWPALNGYLGRTLAEELTVPDDSWLTVRCGDPTATSVRCSAYTSSATRPGASQPTNSSRRGPAEEDTRRTGRTITAL